MRAAKPAVHSPSAELDGFLTRAMQELQTAVGQIRTYAAVLETQFVDEPGVATLREIVRDVRGQAEVVARLVDDVLD
jgi:uncharacterized protein (DUF2342 family)